MATELTPRVKSMRDALRARREAAEAAERQSRNRGNAEDPFAGHSMAPLQTGAPTSPAANGNTDDPFLEGNPNDVLLDPSDDPRVGGHPLHRFLENVDAETVKEAARLAILDNKPGISRDADAVREAAEEMVARVNDEVAQAAFRQFAAEEERYIDDEDGSNFIQILKWLVRTYAPGSIRVAESGDNEGAVVAELMERGVFTVAHLHAAFNALYPSGLPILPEGIARPATNLERRAAQTRAAAGDLEGSILYLLGKMLPELETRLNEGDAESVYEVLGDPQYADAIFTAVITCWEASAMAMNEGYTPSEENRQAIRAVIGNRPATVGLISTAWRQINQAQQRRVPSLPEISERARNQQPTQADLDSMSDEEIENLFSAVRQAKARGTL